MRKSVVIAMAVLTLMGCERRVVEVEEVAPLETPTLRVIYDVETSEEIVTPPTVEVVETVEEVVFDNHYDNLIYQASIETVVDPYVAIAISRLETGHYTSRAFVEGYNFGGITGSEGVRSYESLTDGLETFVSLLEWYYACGMTSPETMQSTYCPPNDDWDEVVNEIKEGLVDEYSRPS